MIISQPASSFPASNEKQFYVSVSRGRENVSIYTDDAEDLLSHVEKHGDRQGATELIKTEFSKTIEIEKEISREIKREIELIKTVDIEPDI
ncbi:hypothetical protein Q4Q35_06285 [Flavivirga aquimarina]|uniref:Uncharacterized protein n=1 Tax=Flavivirga aquimarina TaxID=2027862 RepID=A0ABT8W8F3_9FLAO|nr:hypothetical protein [Flavivirga aquimarina]MDO5969409.1 hypothetical protein [Flavivirga aquimarina]